MGLIEPAPSKPWQEGEVFHCCLKGKCNLHVKEWEKAGDSSSPASFFLLFSSPPLPASPNLSFWHCSAINHSVKTSSPHGRDPGVSSAAGSR